MPKGILTKEVDRICTTCEKVFLAKNYQTKYCSSICSNKSYYKRFQKKFLSQEYTLKKRYGLTLQTYNKLLEQQNNSCAICKEEGKKLYVDHSHLLGEVRGLLCMNCNTGLGHFYDNKKLLKAAIKYLGD